MCGIAATVDLAGGGRATPWALALLRHRGPDGDGILLDPAGNVALEHTRLAILDPDNREADQPFSDASGRYVVVYNGEIFNFREVRAELERRGHRFRTESDTEVVAEGYAAEGERILGRLRGMFALVVWDRHTGDVFAARDQIGVKPLYYRVEDGVVALCSEVRPLLRHPRPHRGLDPAALVEFLAFGANLGAETVVRGLRRLLPGHSLHLRDGRLEVRRWWDVLDCDPVEPPSADAAAEVLRERLGDAVSAALVSDVPVGLMLSGGLDSSTVAALAAGRSTEPLRAYSVAFGRPDDEAEPAARLADCLGLRHTTVVVREPEVRREFDRWLDDLDYPTGNATWIATAFIARAAARDGVKVLLSGDGGDELFGGYTRWMKYLRFYDLLWRRTPAPLLRATGRAARPWTRGLAGDIARRASSAGELFVPSRPFHDDALAVCLTDAGRSAALAAPPERAVEQLAERFGRRRRDDYLAWMSFVTLETTMVEDYLQRLDKMGMRHSVEGRVPLLDPDLARWALALPRGLKVPGHRGKHLFREAVRPLLPRFILDRPKQGFCPPIADWVGEVLAQHSIAEGPLAESGLIRPDAAARLREAGSPPYALWTLSLLDEWARRHLDYAATAPLPA